MTTVVAIGGLIALIGFLLWRVHTLGEQRGKLREENGMLKNMVSAQKEILLRSKEIHKERTTEGERMSKKLDDAKSMGDLHRVLQELLPHAYRSR